MLIFILPLLIETRYCRCDDNNTKVRCPEMEMEKLLRPATSEKAPAELGVYQS